MILRITLSTTPRSNKTPSYGNSPQLWCVLQLGTVHPIAGMCIYVYLDVFGFL